MSEWLRTKTEFRIEHLQCLADALAAINPAWQGHIEVNPAGIQMFDYHRNAVLAQIVVRREFAGGWGDLGFAAQADGTLALVADDGHWNHYRGGCVSQEWLGRVTQQYSGRVIETQADALDMDVSKELRDDGSWRYELTRRGQAAPSAVERLW
jgi:hypothetical protein